MSNEQTHFEEIVLGFQDAELGSMFGKACGKLHKKAFVAFFQNEMVFKLGREEIEPYLHKYEGSQNWDPSGKNRPMKDWLQVPAEYNEDWPRLAQKAKEYLEQIV
ncbi:MAG: hypothetical protein R8P61_17660 [Bacteroidia bacterium]|nr:hypothetical protein [Bacteroidia bacterium]